MTTNEGQAGAASVAPWDRFVRAVERRRIMRRDLRKMASAVHREEQATNALHSPVTRWEDCWDCACTLLADARAALRMPRYPAPDVPCDEFGCAHPSRFIGNNPQQPEGRCECHSWNLTYKQLAGLTLCQRAQPKVSSSESGEDRG